MSLRRVWTGFALGCLLVLGAGACESPSTDDFCNQICICEACDSAAQAQCTSDRDAERTLYESNGCDYDAFVECAVDTATCIDTGISFSTACQDRLLNSCDTVPAQM